MKLNLHRFLILSLFVTASVLLAACGTPSAKDFGGRWKHVNQFQDATVEIPLTAPYTYYASPMDGTLKTMLTRWSNDTGMKLSYRLRSDFTLNTAASRIHTSELRDAAAQLSATYGPQGVAVVVNGPDIVVQDVASMTAPPAAAAPVPHPPAATSAPISQTSRTK